MSDRITMPTRGPEDWRPLLGDPIKHWKPGYSAYALAHSWEAAKGLPREVARVLIDSGYPDLADLHVIWAAPEHQTDMPGRGNASQTDLLVLARGAEQVVLGVEGKVEEDFGPTVDEWLDAASGDRSRQNRSARLRALLAMLSVDFKAVGSLRYQLIHRTAAAVLEAGRIGAPSAVMLVHSFSAEAAHLEDFRVFGRALGVVAGRDAVVDAGRRHGVRLYLAWVTGAPKYLSVQEEEPTAIGVDGRRGGWIAAWRGSGDRVRYRTYGDGEFKQLCKDFRHATIAVDIPIGLPERPEDRRACDTEARALLGRRAPSIFNAPCQEAIRQYRSAGNDVTAVTVRMSRQSLGFLPKVAEVDAVMSAREGLNGSVREVHPELSFAHMKGDQRKPCAPLDFAKKDGRGVIERLRLLESQGFLLDPLALGDEPGNAFALDDLVDAAAAAWSARQIRAAGKKASKRSIPAEPAPGDSGRIWW